jgi:hypothetical protein
MKLITLVVTLGAVIHFSSPAAAAQFPEGTLLKGQLAEVFLVASGETLRWIPDEATFNSLGYKWPDIISVNDEVLRQYKFGETLAAVAVTEKLPTAAEIETKVRQLFSDAPVMITVAKCESGFNQFRSDGSLVRSPNGLYIGVFQIDEKIHSAYALSLGMDIKTVDGNLAYARRLYERSGSQPWSSCASQAAPIKNDLRLGDRSQEVKVLQQILNRAGFVISAAGPGSAGNETEYFGSLTREAVKKFQCAKVAICSGEEDTTGYGLVGPKTRIALSIY